MSFSELDEKRGMGQPLAGDMKSQVDQAFGQYYKGQKLTPGPSGTYAGETPQLRAEELEFRKQQGGYDPIGSLGRGLETAVTGAAENIPRFFGGIGEFVKSGVQATAAP
ncbi:unnamed protein product, partial [marine sediment metagenome]